MKKWIINILALYFVPMIYLFIVANSEQRAADTINLFYSLALIPVVNLLIMIWVSIGDMLILLYGFIEAVYELSVI